ncbi:Ketosteroid isomerase-related protein [Mycobacterium numidiamassiliense]|jgi:ketosteroid isomerase-like protein|uniref:Ketosteroid isomerase-related protein n=1 Tax=Mycobacterium numidiamassiliense TaxID=1841861 RepID=A0A2U3P652_9MYCO|nr:nuclear transport factor 2 family protein [Mycobacterium numidiamassiliense]SPM39242.1 Ketosteroid isomerase-related protein [Mycobacterium numidiamassiliense]
MTPFDAPHAELAWMLLQSLSEGGDVDEGFTLLSEDFTYWSLYTQLCLDKDNFRRSVDQRKKVVEVNIDLLRCINEGDTVVVEAIAEGRTVDGKQYDSPFICIFETRDGLIVSMREYSDTRSAAELFPNWRAPQATQER